MATTASLGFKCSSVQPSSRFFLIHRPKGCDPMFMTNGFNPITNVETQESVAALTFDDGPHPIYTPWVLRILREHDVKATFFMVGEAASRFPEIVHDVAQDGHVIGNHSWNHPNLTKTPSRLHRLQQLRKGAKGTAPYCQRLFRPPFGAQNAQIRFDAWLFRYQMILWNVSTQDWVRQDSGDITKKMIERVKPGCIMLLHDAIYAGNEVPEQDKDRGPMLNGLDRALSTLKRQIRFITVPELLRAGKPVCNWSSS